ncbi:RimK family alpha-L-glutamate ligase [Patescibacteria group bacterium]
MDRTTYNKPNLVILFKEGDLSSYPFSIPAYKQSYRDFFSIAEKYFSIYIVRGISKFRGNGLFTSGYRWNGRSFAAYKKNINARIVYNKGQLFSSGGKEWAMINKGGLHTIAIFKDVTHATFPKIMKRGFRVRNKQDAKRKIKRIRTVQAVYKPIDGFEGKGIVITDKNLLIAKLRKCDGLLEEFLDTSKGIPGLTQSYHDVRMTIMDGKLVQTYIRIPKKGSLLANVARGGSLHEFSFQKLPQSARKIISTVDKKLRRYGHRVYSIDIGFEGNTPYVIEINDQPGLPYKKWKQYYRMWHASLLTVFRNAAAELS